MKKHYLLSLLILAKLSFIYAAPADSAAPKKVSYYVHAGYNFGAAAPLSIPNNIRKIESYSPGFSPYLHFEMRYKLSDKWQVGGGPGLTWKSMQITDSVQYLHTILAIDTAQLEGLFSGTNNTKVRNVYLSLPINVIYNAGRNWTLKGGAYVAYLLAPSFRGTVFNGYLRKGDALGEKVIISEAKFNFDEEERKLDAGLQLGAEKVVWKSLSVNGTLHAGLLPIFPSSFKGMEFKMYNLYFSLGLVYNL